MSKAPHGLCSCPYCQRVLVYRAWRAMVVPFAPPAIFARKFRRGVGFCVRWGHA